MMQLAHCVSLVSSTTLACRDLGRPPSPPTRLESEQSNLNSARFCHNIIKTIDSDKFFYCSVSCTQVFVEIRLARSNRSHSKAKT